VTRRIDVFTIFPDVIESYAGTGILGRAAQQGLIEVRPRDLRSMTRDPHRSVDDQPFGGGPGMVMMPEPVFAAVEAVAATDGLPRPLLLLSPAGRRFDQRMAEELAAHVEGFSLLCARYEGIDQRVADQLVDGEVSVGDYVLAGGELPALTIVESVVRLLPEVLGNAESPLDESFADGLLEYPQYTRPAEFRGWTIPEVLRSGDHGKVASWRRAQALARTLRRRPDMIEARGGLRPEEVQLLAELGEVQLLADHGYDV
jgi:tRNA (guanine37-N1)-methyltransferase